MKQYRIEEICEVISGGTPSTKVANYWNGDIVWLTPKDLSNITTKWISRSSNKITKDGLDNSAARMLPINAVLLSSRAPIGYLALAKKPLCTNQGFKSMICNTNYILPEYLYYYLHTKVEELNNISTGSTFKELSSSLLKNYVVSIHDLTTQQHIVDILGSIDEKIENNERIMDLLIADLGLKYKSTFKNNSNQQVPLSYFIKDTIGGDWGKEQAGGNFLSKVICIRGTDIPELSTGRNGNPPARFILSKNLETKKLEPWEIIIEISGGSPTQSTGRCALITHEMLKQYATPVICTNFCRAIKCKRNEYATYVFSVLSAMYNDNLFFNYENGTTGIKNLDLISILEKETVYLPSETELLSFYQYTEDIYRQVEHFKFQNSKLKELKQLYLKKFFG